MTTAPRAPRPQRPLDEPEPDWQPLSRLPLIASMIDGMLADDRQTYATLLEARPKPSVLDDATVVRTKRVFTEQWDDLWLYEEQLARWSREALTPGQRRSSRRGVVLTRFRGLSDRESAPRGRPRDLDNPARGSTPVGRFGPSTTPRRELNAVT